MGMKPESERMKRLHPWAAQGITAKPRSEGKAISKGKQKK